jgi:predicted ATP-grasp superfamily ATP-dependent carboligase
MSTSLVLELECQAEECQSLIAQSDLEEKFVAELNEMISALFSICIFGFELLIWIRESDIYKTCSN